MDGSFARNLPVGKIMWFAVFGFFAAIAISLGGIGFAIWWAIHHIAFV